MCPVVFLGNGNGPCFDYLLVASHFGGACLIVGVHVCSKIAGIVDFS